MKDFNKEIYNKKINSLPEKEREALLLMDLENDLADFFKKNNADIKIAPVLQDQIGLLCTDFICYEELCNFLVEKLKTDLLAQIFLDTLLDAYPFLERFFVPAGPNVNNYLGTLDRIILGEEQKDQKTREVETADEILNEIENPTPSISNIVDEQEVVPEADVMPFEIKPAPQQSTSSTPQTPTPTQQKFTPNETPTPNPALKISTKIDTAMQSSDIRPTETTYYKIDPYREPAE